MRPLLPALLALAALTACAHEGAGSSTSVRGADRLDRLRASCDERGGILVPSGAGSGRLELDYVCSIHGGAPTR